MALKTLFSVTGRLSITGKKHTVQGRAGIISEAHAEAQLPAKSAAILDSESSRDPLSAGVRTPGRHLLLRYA